jgi:nitrogen regulatory protein PII
MGMTACEVKGFSRQYRHTEIYRGSEYTMNCLPKIRIDLIVGDQNAEQAVNAIIQSSKTGGMGEGKVFITDIKEAVGIRIGEKRGRRGLILRQCCHPNRMPTVGQASRLSLTLNKRLEAEVSPTRWRLPKMR